MRGLRQYYAKRHASIVLPTPTSSEISRRMGSSFRARTRGKNWYGRGLNERRPAHRKGAVLLRRRRRVASSRSRLAVGSPTTLGSGRGKARGLDAVAFERNKEPDGGSVRASYRLEIENVLSGRRQNDSVASARPNYRSDLKRSFCPQFSALLSSQTTDDCSEPTDDTAGSLGEPLDHPLPSVR